NPARSFASALPAGSWRYLWIYFTAPPLGMLAGAELWLRLRGIGSIRCAKLNHHTTRRCIFNCGYRSWGSRTALCLIAVGFLFGERQVAIAAPLVSRIDSIGVTVSDAEASAKFYTQVLSFERVSDIKLRSAEIEKLDGVYGSSVRNVRLRLGTEYL